MTEIYEIFKDGEPMDVASNAIQNLKILASKDHFIAEGLYTGVHDPVPRENLSSKQNSTLQEFIEAVENGATRESPCQEHLSVRNQGGRRMCSHRPWASSFCPDAY